VSAKESVMAKKPCPVVHFEINVKNNNKAKAFYSKLFNWKINVIPQMGYGLVDAGGGKKSQINGGLSENTKTYVTVYVQVPDLNATMAQAKKMGSKVVMKRQDLPEMGLAIAIFRAPDGNPIGVLQSI
jgi:predicted enzyme related to lactoylglutathione lyase